MRLTSPLLGVSFAVLALSACKAKDGVSSDVIEREKVAERESIASPIAAEGKKIAIAECVNSALERVELPGGRFTMGSNETYREEGPSKTVSVNAFDIDATEVTNDDFRRFVAATGYVTDAEKPQYGFGAAGGAVFTPPTVNNPTWWTFVEGANWKSPSGPASTIEGLGFYPVVQVSLADARAYAKWAERRLPTEAEWEYAAKAGSDTLYVWGDERAPNKVEQANTWQGAFPVNNTTADGYTALAPAGCFPPNDFGLYDMIGNVWEWTDSAFDADPNRNRPEAIYTIKGGSYLCAENYCRRYRASARQPQEVGFTTNHIGFRTIKDISE
ncbi:MAG: formylglycine-generating enzyme family protein [Maricaulaceae bacterium]